MIPPPHLCCAWCVLHGVYQKLCFIMNCVLHIQNSGIYRWLAYPVVDGAWPAPRMPSVLPPLPAGRSPDRTCSGERAGPGTWDSSSSSEMQQPRWNSRRTSMASLPLFAAFCMAPIPSGYRYALSIQYPFSFIPLRYPVPVMAPRRPYSDPTLCPRIVYALLAIYPTYGMRMPCLFTLFSLLVP